MTVGIEINGKPVALYPDSLNWQEPRILAKDGNLAPVFAPYWGASLSISIPIETRRISWAEWMDIRDAATHTFLLPHPKTGILTTYTGVYVDSAVGRFDTSEDCVKTVGFDIVLSKISVTI